MHAPSLLRPVAYSLLLLGLSACDPDLEAELDPDDELGLGDLPADDSVLEIDVETASEERTSCNLGLPDIVVADANKAATVMALGWVPAAQDTRRYRVVGPSGSHPLPTLESWVLRDGIGNPPPSIGASGSWDGWSTLVWASGNILFYLDLQARWWVPPGASHKIEVSLHELDGTLVCADQTYFVVPPLCGQGVRWWSTSPWPTPSFDGANCHVAPLPAGAQPFIWNGGWYVHATNGNQCSIGVWDNANCYIGHPPVGNTAFIYNNALYYTP